MPGVVSMVFELAADGVVPGVKVGAWGPGWSCFTERVEDDERLRAAVPQHVLGDDRNDLDWSGFGDEVNAGGDRLVAHNASAPGLEPAFAVF